MKEKEKLLNLIDIVWSTAFEDESVPSTKLAMEMLSKAGYIKKSELTMDDLYCHKCYKFRCVCDVI